MCPELPGGHVRRAERARRASRAATAALQCSMPHRGSVEAELTTQFREYEKMVTQLPPKCLATLMRMLQAGPITRVYTGGGRAPLPPGALPSGLVTMAPGMMSGMAFAGASLGTGVVGALPPAGMGTGSSCSSSGCASGRACCSSSAWSVEAKVR